MPGYYCKKPAPIDRAPPMPPAPTQSKRIRTRFYNREASWVSPGAGATFSSGGSTLQTAPSMFDDSDPFALASQCKVPTKHSRPSEDTAF